MSKTRTIVPAAVLLALGLTSAGEAGWVHYANSVRAPEGNLQHRTALTRVLVIPEDAAETSLCILYRNTTDKPKKGRVLATVTALPPAEGAEQFTVSFALGVSDNRAEKCKDGPAMAAGTVVTFVYDFRGMPRVLGKKGQYVDVTGVVSTIGEPDFEMLSLRPVEDGRGRIRSASSIFVAQEEAQKHPGALAHTVVVTRDFPGAQVCVVYTNNFGQRNKGRIVTDVDILRADGTVESLKLAGSIQKNEYLACKAGGDLLEGDMLEFDVDFRKLPRVRLDGQKTDFSAANALISDAGEVEFRPPPAPEVPDVPEVADDDGGGGDPAPVGGITADDQRAVSKLMLNNVKVQLQRPKGDNPAKWIAVGPKSTTLPNDASKVDPQTAGLGSSPAAAVADYERKRGSLGAAGSLLGARDLAALVWYSGMNSAGGPTSVRRDSGGGWHSEWFRSGRGIQFNSGPSFAAVIETLQKQGL